MPLELSPLADLLLARSVVVALIGSLCLWALSTCFVNAPATERETSVAMRAGYFPVGNAKQTAPYGERDPLPKGYGIRTGLSDLLKPLNAEAGVVAKEDSIPTVLVMLMGIVLLFLFYLLLLLIDNQSVLLPPEDEFDEYVANFLPYFFFGEKSVVVALIGSLCLWALSTCFVNAPATERETSVAMRAGYFPVGNAKQTAPYGERDPLPKGYGIRTGLSDLLKPLNAEAGVVAKEDSIPTVLVMLMGIVLLFLFYLLLLLIDNQSVLLPPEDEFDEYVANFLPYFFFGEK
ncbi:unnamed protein product [Effrenium voratum]|nr:unnamed protein product [Effrenium voratum]